MKLRSFMKFIFEESEIKKPVVFAFGRMNPPTTGHGVLVDKVKELAKKHKASHEIVLSSSQDAEKNPLTPEQKVKHAKRFFPDTNITAADKEHPTLIHHAARLSAAGHDHLIMVAGSDRVEGFRNLLNSYNGKPDKKGNIPFNFKKISVVSAGERDPDAEGTTGMSASKMRHHAANNDFESFRKGIPSHVSDEHSKELFNDVRKGMGY